MLEIFNTSATTQSTLGNVNWNGENGDIRESIRRVNELANKHLGKEKPPDLIIFTPEAFAEVKQYMQSPVAGCETAETFSGIKFEIVAGDTPATLQAMQKACLGERVILATKGEAGLCVQQYYFPDNTVAPYAIHRNLTRFPDLPIRWPG